jgi:putative ABC transport system ATP-binding protein
VVAIRDGKTSTETVRQVQQLEKVLAGKGLPHEESQAHEFTYHEYVVLDTAGRLQVPAEYLERYSIGDRAQLEAVEEGILIRAVDGEPNATSREAETEPGHQISRLFSDEEPPRRKGIWRRLWHRRS